MCWNCYNFPGGDPYKIYVQGGVDVEDFYKEVNYAPKRRVKSKQVKRTRPGCPDNDNGAHVYVWTSEYQRDSLFYRFYGYHDKQQEVCAGCGHTRKTKNSDRYEKIKIAKYNKMYGGPYDVVRGAPVSWKDRQRFKPSFAWWHWEQYDIEYAEYRREYIKRKGFNSIVYGW